MNHAEDDLQLPALLLVIACDSGAQARSDEAPKEHFSAPETLCSIYSIAGPPASRAGQVAAEQQAARRTRGSNVRCERTQVRRERTQEGTPE